jgi:hypothetical protein
MIERGHFRESPRSRAECRVSVAFLEREKPPLVAYTSDVGAGGLCLAYDEPLDLGERVEVSLTTPSRWAPLVLRAEVAWQRGVGAGEAGETGFAFVEPSEADAAALRDLVATLAFDA